VNHAYLWGLLDTPRYHMMMAIVAVIVLATVIAAWRHLYTTLSRQQRILSMLTREVSGLGHASASSARSEAISTRPKAWFFEQVSHAGQNDVTGRGNGRSTT
jgi:hypothetical protein